MDPPGPPGQRGAWQEVGTGVVGPGVPALARRRDRSLRRLKGVRPRAPWRRMLTAVGLNAASTAPPLSRRREPSKRPRPCPGCPRVPQGACLLARAQERGPVSPAPPRVPQRRESKYGPCPGAESGGRGCGCGDGWQAKCRCPPGPAAVGTGTVGGQERLGRAVLPDSLSACRDTREMSRYGCECLVFSAGGREGKTVWDAEEMGRALCHPPQPAGPPCAPGGGREGSGPVQRPFWGAEETGCDSCPNPRIGKKKPFLSAETHASNFNFPDD